VSDYEPNCVFQGAGDKGEGEAGEGFEDGFSDGEDGLDVASGSGEETSPPRFTDPRHNGAFQDNVVVN